jgi:hypothetical protein
VQIQRFRSIKLGKNQGLHRRVDADAGIADGQLDTLPTLRSRGQIMAFDCNRTAIRGVFDKREGIAQEALKELSVDLAAAQKSIEFKMNALG